MAGESISRILYSALRRGLRRVTRPVAIIPLGPESLRGSSSLPEGHCVRALAQRSGRAGPPLLFDLAPRGVFRAPNVAIRAVGSYPTFSPLPLRAAETGQP